MPTACSRCSRRTQQTAQVTQDTAQAALRLLENAEDTAAEEEPMRRYPHPIPTSVCQATVPGDSSATLDLLAERVACQNQLLVDLVEAVNALTAALPASCPSD